MFFFRAHRPADVSAAGTAGRRPAAFWFKVHFQGHDRRHRGNYPIAEQWILARKHRAIGNRHEHARKETETDRQHPPPEITRHRPTIK